MALYSSYLLKDGDENATNVDEEKLFVIALLGDVLHDRIDEVQNRQLFVRRHLQINYVIWTGEWKRRDRPTDRHIARRKTDKLRKLRSGPQAATPSGMVMFGC